MCGPVPRAYRLTVQPKNISTYKNMKNDRAYVYVLRLQGSPANWYIGSTTNIEARICEHWAGQGAQWTQKHPPIGVAEVIECLTGDPLPLERAKTAEMARPCRPTSAPAPAAACMAQEGLVPFHATTWSPEPILQLHFQNFV